ncbi:MAG: caspase family protein [Sphaerochaeta sp.]|nr:caspase family protein [Sphaerochaeta sp.]
MKKILLFLTLVSILFFTSCELFLDEPIQGKVYYINVGIDYENNSNSDDNLSGTVNDAKELHEALGVVITKAKRTGTGYLMVQEGAFAENPSDSEYPSIAKLQAKLSKVQGIAKEEDLTILTYSGHGEETTGRLVLAYSGGVNQRLDPATLLSWMAAIPGKKLIILDSCFSGMFVEDSPSSTNIILNNSIEKFFETYHSSDAYGEPDLFVFTASTNTLSYEKDFGTDANPHPHGIFSYALLEALGWNHISETDPSLITISAPPAAKNEQITVDGLFKFIKKNQDIDSSYYGSVYQHPMTTGGPLDLVLFNL